MMVNILYILKHDFLSHPPHRHHHHVTQILHSPAKWRYALVVVQAGDDDDDAKMLIS